jgi:hypothetical protein
MEDAYIVDNSIHHSFQRAVTVHATHFSRVANNVAYNVRGHTYFVEDGNEMFNVFENNLAAVTHCSEGPLAGDAHPASFWTSTPRNIWRHNVRHAWGVTCRRVVWRAVNRVQKYVGRRDLCVVCVEALT